MGTTLRARAGRLAGRTVGLLPILFCIVIGYGNWLVFRPGLMSCDSLVQYRQAVTWDFNDAHPPLMAVLLAVVRSRGGDLEHLMLAQCCCGVLGVYFLATAVLRHFGPPGGSWVGWAALAVVATLMAPLSPLCYYLMTFWKDSWLIVFLSWSVAMVLPLFRPGGNSWAGVAQLMLGVLFMVLSLLVRHNAIVILPVFSALVYLAAGRVAARFAAASAAARVVARFAAAAAPLVLFLLSSGMIRFVFDVQRSRIDRFVVYFDLVGVCAYNDDAAARLPAIRRLLAPDFRSRYVPGYCESLADCMDPCLRTIPAAQREAYAWALCREYRLALWHYPLTLLRLKRDAFLYHFAQTPCSKFYPEIDPNEFGLRLNDEFIAFRDWLRRFVSSVFQHPVLSWVFVKHQVWLVVNAVLVVALALVAFRRRSRRCLAAVLAFGVPLSYYLSYLVVSVSADFRYMYPATLITQVGVLAIAAGALRRLAATLWPGQSGALSSSAPESQPVSRFKPDLGAKTLPRPHRAGMPAPGVAVPADSVWIVIPAYNEEGRIGAVLDQLLHHWPNIVVVDDASTEGTVRAVLARPVWLLRHVVNLGQGAALQTGISFALRREAQYIITFDADGQHSPDDLAALLGPLAAGRADFTLGSRFLGGAEGMPASRRLLLRLAVLFTRIVSEVRLTDVHNGLRAMTRHGAIRLVITMNRMEHASQIVDQIHASGLPYVEVPVVVRYTRETLAKGQQSSAALKMAATLIVEKITR
jgi:polyprenyl-phospho-N-acetylgalactosaminyl synthase